MKNSTPNSAAAARWLIAFHLDPDTEYPNIYTLFVTEDSPLVSDEYIVFFNEPGLASKAVEMYGDGVKDGLPQEVDLHCYIAESLYLINSEAVDPSATIINSLNILLDLVKATRLSMPEEYERLLYAFADYLTFDRDLSVFFAQEGNTRSRVLDAVLWCIGAVVSKSKVLTYAELDSKRGN